MNWNIMKKLNIYLPVYYAEKVCYLYFWLWNNWKKNPPKPRMDLGPYHFFYKLAQLSFTAPAVNSLPIQ